MAGTEEGNRHMTDRSNITLIGMPGAGKSTIGIILAKYLTFGFIDTDVLIQINHQKSLQEIMDEHDYLTLRQIEEQEILKLNVDRHIISTGGSVVYSSRAMEHLAAISRIIFLAVDFPEITRRIHNFEQRGIAKREDQSFEELFAERKILYEKYAGLTISCRRMDQEQVAEKIVALIERDRSKTG